MKPIPNRFLATVFVSTVALMCLSTGAQAEYGKETARAAPDNSARNEVDKDLNTILPEDQSNEPALLERTAAIRREITSKDNLSVAAKNVKIITLASGTTVLRGPVNTVQEKSVIEDIAKRLSGNNPVRSFLEVGNG